MGFFDLPKPNKYNMTKVYSMGSCPTYIEPKITDLQGLEPIHAASAPSPHEAKPLDPVVGGHWRVPHTRATVVHAMDIGQAHKQHHSSG